MIHTQVLKWGFLADIFVPNSLMDSYAKVGGGIGHAKKLFDEMTERDVVSWNSMVAGLARAGELTEARRMFDEMPERDIVSWNSMLDGLAKAGEMDAAFELFEQALERNVVSWLAMIGGGYIKVGDMDMARMLFDKMPVKNLVAWTIMVSGYAEKGLAKEALSLFDRMEEAGLEFDSGAIVSILAGCAESGLLGLGKRVHAYVERSTLSFSPQVCNALVDMYAKYGNLNKAWSAFDGLVERDLVTWNSIIQGLAMHGHGKRALDLSRILGIDNNLIKNAFGGLLKEALDLIKSMPLEPNAII